MNISHRQAGDLIAGRYQLKVPLGVGGHGEVWVAVEQGSSREVAVKMLRPGSDLATRQRFQREARLLAEISHPNCIQLLDFGIVDGGADAYIVTELARGERLDVWASRPRSDEEKLAVLDEVLAALGAAHAGNVLHRDLKPENIVIGVDPTGALGVKVLDFGMAKLVGEVRQDITATGEVHGSAGYMSPELLRARSDIGPQSDLYALGVIGFELFEGRPPFEARTSFELSMKHLTEPPPTLSAGPAALGRVVGNLLQKEPQDRFASAADARAALPIRRGRSQTRQVPVQRKRDRTRQSEVRQRRVSRERVLALGVVGLALTAAGGFWLVRQRDSPMTPRARPVAPATEVATRSTERTTKPEAATATDAVEAFDGCGRELKPGRQRLSDPHAVMQRSVASYVPAGYEPHRRHPVVLLLHDDDQTPAELLDAPTWIEKADEHGFVLLATVDELGRHGKWRNPDAVHAAWDDLHAAGEAACLDLENVFVVGVGSGGAGATHLSCAYGDKIRALVVGSHRLKVGQSPCVPRTPPAQLFVAPLADGYDPVDGGTKCVQSDAKISLTEHEGVLRTAHKCSTEKAVSAAHQNGECFEYKCESGLVVCHVDGGRPWPEWEARVPERCPNGECKETEDGRPTAIGGSADATDRCNTAPAEKFPYIEVAWEFMTGQASDAGPSQ